MKKIIRYLGGGSLFHPVDEQAELIDEWLGPDRVLENRTGRRAFEDLDTVDLFVVAGLHFTRMNVTTRTEPMEYEPMTDADMAAFRDYVASGRPVLGFHGGVASYDDRVEFRTCSAFIGTGSPPRTRPSASGRCGPPTSLPPSPKASASSRRTTRFIITSRSIRPWRTRGFISGASTTKCARRSS